MDFESSYSTESHHILIACVYYALPSQNAHMHTLTHTIQFSGSWRCPMWVEICSPWRYHLSVSLWRKWRIMVYFLAMAAITNYHKHSDLTYYCIILEVRSPKCIPGRAKIKMSQGKPLALFGFWLLPGITSSFFSLFPSHITFCSQISLPAPPPHEDTCDHIGATR